MQYIQYKERLHLQMRFKAHTVGHKWQWNMLETLGLTWRNCWLISYRWDLESWSSSCAQAAKLCTVWEHCLSHFSHHKRWKGLSFSQGLEHLFRALITALEDLWICSSIWQWINSSLQHVPLQSRIQREQAQKSQNLRGMHVRISSIKEDTFL